MREMEKSLLEYHSNNYYTQEPLTYSKLVGESSRQYLSWKDPDAGKDWRQEKRMTEDEMVGWHHWLDGHEQALSKLQELVKDREA